MIDTISISVTKAFADTGKKNELNEQLDHIVNTLPGTLKKLFPSMRIAEIPIAINRGIYKEFGEYYGINVAEIVRFCRTHLESIERINAAKETLKPIPDNKPAPSKEKLFELYKNNLLDAYTKKSAGHNIEVNAPALYDFCDKLKLIIFTPKEKFEFLSQAAQAVIKDQQNILFVTVEDFKRKPYQKIIDVIKNHLEHGEPLTIGIKDKIIMKSKFLTLKAFFVEFETSELNLSELIDSKKDLFINEV